MYSNFEVLIQNNGKFSDPVAIQQGVHQGGPASSLYFLVIAEILALKIKKNVNIEGIPVNEILNVLSQFADDMDVFSKFNQKSYSNINSELCRFQDNSGFAISPEKTTMFRIGAVKDSQTELIADPMQTWSGSTIKVLGIDIFHCEDNLM